VSITDEYARFAARMMVAAAFFDVADNDASGEMSKIELFEALRRVTITQSKVSALCRPAPSPPPPRPGLACSERRGKQSTRRALLDCNVCLRANRWQVTVNDTISLVEFIMKIADSGLDLGNEALPNAEEEEGAQEVEEAVEDSDEEPTINREELVNTYCGPPCSVQSLLAIIKRKNRQGRYLIHDEDYEMYDKIDKQVAEELRKEKHRREKAKEAERKAKATGQALNMEGSEKEVRSVQNDLTLCRSACCSPSAGPAAIGSP
jgi:hypothetical protein